MRADVTQQLEECIDQLKRGRLTEERLRAFGKALGSFHALGELAQASLGEFTYKEA